MADIKIKKCGHAYPFSEFKGTFRDEGAKWQMRICSVAATADTSASLVNVEMR